MRFRPCIDLHGGKVKQIVGLSLSDSGDGLKTNFESAHDSAYYAGLYRRDNLPGGHVIMLGSGNEAAAKRALAAWPGGLQLGGGIHPGNAQEYLDAGAAQLIVTSYVFSGGELHYDKLREMERAVGRGRLVLDLSCRIRDGRYWIVTDRWQKFTRLELTEETMADLAGFCCEFLVHAVDVEGKQAGIDETLVRRLAGSPVPAVYAGGVATFEDIERIRRAGEGRVDYTVGSALDIFGGTLSYGTIAKKYT